MAAMELDLANLEAEHKADLRRIKELLTDKDEKRRQDPDYSLALRLAEFWVEQTGRDAGRTELGMARVGAVMARLKGRKRMGAENPARDVAKAILGAKVDAWVNAKGKRHDELKLICRDEATLEDFIGRYERWKARRAA